ncbi:phenylalanyl-tRNA synthetase alpha chain [Candidatus Kinetoplastibacterium blastocrithidii TCC012E]|uniref:Phenylalanine--tRNA ligase alpha subunit n=1 Tax=Candidatus Kinetoplastidibacterium blastocrithidiae TCC012E TaxID=1208922 RepID=M1M0A3_9PROT|nr:phenylalanine--tRNA ligase subunit alpha [Candidatus Kinetoplastibacterium blastocrithidii]AFZ83605.1 phenylalanyl-tRNA synthetase subunit alpha [Candidatus Kinetoplastibacterium blastocrithidii (ex Strigomonas culicis)]AGF49726.1 phenylalanyl-tRNA synthetase alpha chain [Candidatus Kinetoplastibacterium blastocrithidii TCC012E]
MNLSLDNIIKQAEYAFESAKDSTGLENAKAHFLGKNGVFASLLKGISNVRLEDRRGYGSSINSAKKKVDFLLSRHRERLLNKELELRCSSEEIDVTLPGRGLVSGSVHPIMRSWERIEKIFRSIGFDVIDGPELETDWNNFTALNSPLGHPARSMQDTFYLDLKDKNDLQLLLRTHTSPMQVRYSRTNKPPIKIISPGKTYRVDSDSTHSPMFHQVEGLWIDRNVSFSDLKGVYTSFLKCFFENDDLKIRFRPSFFPFTEPSAEIDMMFTTGSNRGKWLEISGSGQVHPNVIRNFGLNPEDYMGFAFGSGLERLTMLRYGINDLRCFYENDLRFLRQIR